MARRERRGLPCVYISLRVNTENQEDEAARQAELSKHERAQWPQISTGTFFGFVCAERADEAKRGDLWWWLNAAADSSSEGSKGSSLEGEELPNVTRDDTVNDDNQCEVDEEEHVWSLKEAQTREPATVSFEDLFAGILDESAPESDQSSDDQQQRCMQQSKSDADSWEVSQNAASSGEDGCYSGSSISSDASSLLSQSAGSHSDSSSSTGSKNWVERRETEGKLQSQDEAVTLGLGEDDMDMMTLWLGSDSSASISGESEQASDCDSSSTLDGGDAENSSGQMSSLSRSASVEDLDSSSSVNTLSSLSSFSAQSGVCAISSPRRIENIPVAPAVATNTKGRNGKNSLSTDNPKCWYYHDFVNPEAPLNQRDPEPRQRRLKLDHGDTSFILKKRLANLHERSDLNAIRQQPQFVIPDAELFVKFSELHAIIVDHAPRRHGFFLDVGCGTSSICKEMVLRGYNHVYGIDIAPAKLEFQRDQCRGLDQFVRFQEMDARELQFPDQLFGCIFSKATLDIVASNYVYDPTVDDGLDELQQILREIWRCLEPGGVWLVVSCYGSRSADTLASLDRSGSNSADADASEHLRKPWWQWRGLCEFIECHYDHVKSYGAGVPLLQHGKRVKPFVVMVYKRKEANNHQRLARLYRNQMEETRSEREYALATQWLAEKRRLHAEEVSTVHETRQMVVEDAMARSSESESHYQSAMRAREAARVEIYRAMLAADRAMMAAEDALAAAVRVEVTALVVFMSTVLIGIADSAVGVTLVKESEVAVATAAVVVEKDPVAGATTGAECAVNSHQAALNTMTSPAVADNDSTMVIGALSDGDNIQLAEPVKSMIQDDSLVTDGGALIAAELDTGSAIASSEKDSVSESQHIAVLETLEGRATADITEQLPAIQDGEAVLKNDAICDAAQCSENVRESDLPVTAGDTKTGESEDRGSANLTVVGEGESVSDSKPEAAAAAPTTATEPQPDMTTDGQSDSSQHQTGQASGYGDKAKNEKSRLHLLPVDPLHAGRVEYGREREDIALTGAAVGTTDRHAMASPKAVAEVSEPSHDSGQVDEAGFIPDRGGAGNNSTRTPAKVPSSTSYEVAPSSENSSNSASVDPVGRGVSLLGATKDSISEKTASMLDDGILLLNQEVRDADVADASSTDPGLESFVEPEESDHCAPPASVHLSSEDDEANEIDDAQGNNTSVTKLGETQEEPYAVKPQRKFQLEDEGNRSEDNHPTHTAQQQILPLQATNSLPASAVVQCDDESISSICLEAMGLILDTICRYVA